MSDEQRRAIRRLLTGQEDEPVEFTTGGASSVPADISGTMTSHPTGVAMHESNGHAPLPTAPQEGLQLDPVKVLEEVQRINPMLVDLAMERVARVHREQELAAVRREAEALQRALTERVTEPEGVPADD